MYYLVAPVSRDQHRVGNEAAGVQVVRPELQPRGSGHGGEKVLKNRMYCFRMSLNGNTSFIAMNIFTVYRLHTKADNKSFDCFVLHFVCQVLMNADSICNPYCA